MFSSLTDNGRVAAITFLGFIMVSPIVAEIAVGASGRDDLAIISMPHNLEELVPYIVEDQREVSRSEEFIDKYNDLHGEIPGDVAALTWDAMRLVAQAIQDCGELTGDLEDDRLCVREALGKIEDFAGITGDMTFDANGDPEKCAVIVRIEGGKFTFYKQACP